MSATKYEELRYVRLPNWGRYAAIDPCRPDSSCANPIYAMGRYEAESYGEITEDTVVIEYTTVVEEREPIDESDAEVMDFWIRQLKPVGHKITLAERFVLHHKIKQDRVDAAIRSILILMDDNRQTNMRMR